MASDGMNSIALNGATSALESELKSKVKLKSEYLTEIH